MRACLRRRDGFALVAVLWVLVVAAGVAAALHGRARAGRAAAAHAEATVAATWAARAALALSLDALDRRLRRAVVAFDLDMAGDTLLPPLAWTGNGAAARVVITDARTRVSLNRAAASDLQTLFRTLGVSPLEAERLADATLDARDPDDVPRPLGAEAAAYARLEPPGRPRNAPFTRVEELRGVPGFTPARYALVAPFLTVSGDGRINVNAAPAPVLVTLPGIDPAAARAIVARREAGPVRNVLDLLAALPAAVRERADAVLGALTDRVAFGPRDVEIAATACRQGAPTCVEIRAVVRLDVGSAWRVISVSES